MSSVVRALATVWVVALVAVASSAPAPRQPRLRLDTFSLEPTAECSPSESLPRLRDRTPPTGAVVGIASTPNGDGDRRSHPTAASSPSVTLTSSVPWAALAGIRRGESRRHPTAPATKSSLPTAGSSPSATLCFFGSLTGLHILAPAVAIATTGDGMGDCTLTKSGEFFALGDARGRRAAAVQRPSSTTRSPSPLAHSRHGSRLRRGEHRRRKSVVEGPTGTESRSADRSCRRPNSSASSAGAGG